VLAGRALVFYAGKLIWPAGDLLNIYPRWKIDPAAAWQWLPVLGVLLVLAAAWALRDRLGRGVVAVLVFFVVAHAPTLGFVDFGFMGHSFVADHFQYFPSVALIPLVIAAVAFALDRLGARILLAGGALLLAVAAAGCAWQTHRMAAHYDSVEHFWAWNDARNSTSVTSGALGDVYLRAGDVDRAVPLLRRSFELKDNASSHFRIAEVLAVRGSHEEAIAEFTKAIEVNSRTGRWKDIDSRAWFNIGALRWMQRRFPESAQAFAAAARIDPRNAQYREWADNSAAILAAPP
jgi:tetratricopeptide (TPR) repeat protein